MGRAETLESLERVNAVLRRYCEAGALGAGVELDFRQVGRSYAQMESDVDLEGFWVDAMAEVGRDSVETPMRGGSTDMSNVSLEFPTIHPIIKIGDNQPIHTVGFAELAKSEAGDAAVLDAAWGMACVAVDAALDPEQRERLLAGERRVRG